MTLPIIIIYFNSTHERHYLITDSISMLYILTEDEFDSQWEIPDEPSDEMEISQCSVTVRSFGDR